MALEQKLHLKLAQKLVMTPTLQQAIKLLQLSRLELEQALTQEMQANPLLELNDEAPSDDESAAPEEPADEESSASPDSPSEERGAADGVPAVEERSAEEAPPQTDPFGEVDLDALFSNYLHEGASVAPAWEEGEESALENSPDRSHSMFERLSSELRLMEVPHAIQGICEFVIGNLDPDGYLRTPDEELAKQVGATAEQVREAIAIVQGLEPPGIAARSLQECFLLQLQRLPVENGNGIVELTKSLVEVGFDDLLHQRWDRLVQRFGIGRERIREVLAVLHRLDPRPGGQLAPGENQGIEPDVLVTKDATGWRVTLNDDGMPRLRMSARYLRLLKSRGLEGEARGYLRERMRSALWFLRSVEQRQSTIARVATAIVRRQEAFLERGLPHLRPLVLRDIADDIDMHESTVSRVVANKYMATPRGVFPLKFFFHSAISHAVDGDISSVVVKDRIRDLIEQEDPTRPLSDARVARQLNRLGIRIARRTVAKYRDELGVPSSEQRRRALR